MSPCSPGLLISLLFSFLFSSLLISFFTSLFVAAYCPPLNGDVAAWASFQSSTHQLPVLSKAFLQASFHEAVNGLESPHPAQPRPRHSVIVSNTSRRTAKMSRVTDKGEGARGHAERTSRDEEQFGGPETRGDEGDSHPKVRRIAHHQTSQTANGPGGTHTS